jgi:hypothetical protein
MDLTHNRTLDIISLLLRRILEVNILSIQIYV